jgi:hypothetical protein
MPLATAADLIPANDVQLSIISGAPATYDASGYATLMGSADRIGVLVSPGDFGPETEIGTTKLIGDTSVAKTPGTTDFGTMQIEVALVNEGDDDGQDAILDEAEATTKTLHSMKVEFAGTGSATNYIVYMTGYLTGARIMPGTAPDSVKVQFSFAVTAPWVRVAATDS